MKVTIISQYGCKTDADKDKWCNYDKEYTGYRLIKGQDEGKEVELNTNGKGYITGIKLGDLGMTTPEVPKETLVATAGVPIKSDGLLVKVVTAQDPQIWEEEINDFNRKNKVRFTQTLNWGVYLVAVIFYEN